MKLNFVVAVFSAVILSAGVSSGALLQSYDGLGPVRDREFRQALGLYGRGMYERSEAAFAEISRKRDDFEAEGYRVLCAVRLSRDGYRTMMDDYIRRYPYSGLIPQMRYYYGMNLFDASDYKGASAEFAKISKSQLYRRQVPEFIFKKAYCDFETGNLDRAYTRFKEVVALPHSDYTAPSRYTLGYICYQKSMFSEAESWFREASRDHRFKEMSNYYILECRFMDKDYGYVLENGPDMIPSVPADRKVQLARLISESGLVLGDVETARRYYDMSSSAEKAESRSDYFYAGSVMYAAKDWKGAVDNFSMMTDRTDSLGQIANYELAYSYIQLKNKVAAMGAFKDASATQYNPVIAEDAYYNYAKLAFDLNNDISAFNSYLDRYSDRKRGDRIYAYIAMGALNSRDYAAAVDAYDRIDELDDDMKSNYMKAHYLRASQLVQEGSWRAAIPCLKASAYYSDRRGMFNQLSRFWLAESYYRDGQYDNALSTLRDLYNTSALYGMDESYLIPYNIAYSHFQKGDYKNAEKWFSEYLKSGKTVYRKESLLRRGDSFFFQRNYSSALESYKALLKDYYDVNDIYPYYQAALSYGLTGDGAKKISVLSAVADADPSSAFYPEAMYELGRSYVRAGSDAKAVECFNRLIGNVKDSTYMAMSLIELGTLSRNRSETDKALGYFKKVVEQMPKSQYADDALAAIESIYQTGNDPDSYLAYIDNIGRSSVKTDQEKEQMIFSAAEQIFLSGNYQKAIASLNSYIGRYPDGSGVPQAEFYLAESYKASGDRERARDHYAYVMKNGSGSFAELSIAGYAALSYQLQMYDDAFSGYSQLYDRAVMPGNKYSAVLGMMRSAYAGKKYGQALKNAETVKRSEASSPETVREADYIIAKSYLGMSMRDEALAALAPLAENPSDGYGAEAAYILVLDSYERGEFKSVEDKVYALADAGTPHQYWLAKSFIVLGDAFAEQGEYEQAKATFESILEGYSPEKDDDVKSNVEVRLSRLGELMTVQND